MAIVQARALYDFVTEVAGELCFNANEVLLITNQNVGNGWWEARNSYGQVGLVPQSYFEIGIGKWQSQPRHSSTPPRTSPARSAKNGDHSSTLSTTTTTTRPLPLPPRPPPSTIPLVDSVDPAAATLFLPSGRPIPPVKPPGLFARTSGILNHCAGDYDYDDDDDGSGGGNGVDVVNDGGSVDDVSTEWDEESTLYIDDDEEEEEEDDLYEDDDDDVATTAATVKHDMWQDLSIFESDDRQPSTSTADDNNTKQTSTPKKQSRIANFTKVGGDAYLFDMHCRPVPEAITRIYISETPDGNPCWSTCGYHPFTCSVLSPKKATKFRGMKTFIAYQIVPSFSPVAAVSRRYKQFDWLQQRLVEKFSTVTIPPLPEKQISGRFAEQFVQFRLRQLQLWIDRMCRHPVVARSEVFQHFITCADDKMWKRGKRQVERDRYRGGMFFQTVVAPTKPLDARHVEQTMDNFGRFVRSFDDSVRHLYGVSECNAKKHTELFGKEFNKLSGSLSALAKSFEYDERPVAQPLTKAVSNLAKTVTDIGQLHVNQPQHDLYYLLEGLNEYKGLLSTLPDILLVYRASTNKIQESAGNLSEAEIETVENRADVITYTVLAEMEHFQHNRVTDFNAYMQRYLHGQIAFYRQITLRLQDALRQFESI